MTGPGTPTRSFIESMAVAIAGAALFHLLHLPAPSLSGAMVAAVGLLIAGRRIHMPAIVVNTAMLCSGVAMGSAVTPEMLGGFQKYPLSIGVFVLSVMATIWLTQAYLRHVGGWDRLTALFAATPGALSTVLAVAADTRADMLRLTMAQSVRLFALVAVLPALVFSTGGGVALSPRGDVTLPVLALMCGVGLLVALALTRVGLAAPWIFGGMLASAVLHGSGLVKGDAPRWFMEVSFMCVGLFIATRFAAVTRAALMQSLGLSLGALVIGLAVAVAASAFLHFVSGLPFGQVLVAFAPGGLEAMMVLGASLGLDPIYVGLHHLLRFLGIAFMLPVVVPFVLRLEAANVPPRDNS